MNIHIDDIESDAKLNSIFINFAIKRNTASCEAEITLKSNSGTRAII